MLAQSIPLPGFVPTMQPALVADAPEGDRWFHEIKYDGYRTELLLNGAGSRAFTRNGHDWPEKYQLILNVARDLTDGPALLDGEIIVQGEEGHPDFHALRRAITLPARPGSYHRPTVEGVRRITRTLAAYLINCIRFSVRVGRVPSARGAPGRRRHSLSERIGFGYALVMFRSERRHRLRLVKPDEGSELPGQDGLAVMTP